MPQDKMHCRQRNEEYNFLFLVIVTYVKCPQNRKFYKNWKTIKINCKKRTFCKIDDYFTLEIKYCMMYLNDFTLKFCILSVS